MEGKEGKEGKEGRLKRENMFRIGVARRTEVTFIAFCVMRLRGRVGFGDSD